MHLVRFQESISGVGGIAVGKVSFKIGDRTRVFISLRLLQY